MSEPAKTLFAPCPACGAKVYFKAKPELGQTYVCNSCDATLEIIENEPVVLEWVFEEDEYEYDDDEYDEDLMYDDDEEYDDDYDDEDEN